MPIAKPRTLALLVTMIAAAAAPPTASADPIVFTDYDVLIEGAGTYAHHAESPGSAGPNTDDTSADFSFRTHFPKVTFTGNVPGQGAGTSVLTVNSAKRTSVLRNVDETDTLTCSANAGPLQEYGGALMKSAVRKAPTGESGIDIDVVGGLEIPIPNCDGPHGDGEVVPIRLWDTPEAFNQFFTFPHEIVGFGKVIQLIGKTSTGTGCPGHRSDTTSCVLTWKATVTFVRTGRQTIGERKADDDDLFVPIPIPKPAAADDDDLFVPIPVPKPAAADDDDLFVPIPLKASMAPNASSASATFACAVACTGTATATPLASGKASAAKVRVLASKRFRGKAGKPFQVRVELGASARKAARRSGGIRLTVKAKPKGGATVRKVVTLKLKRR